jgi:hypothetical protein
MLAMPVPNTIRCLAAQQHGRLHEGVLAADDLIGPGSAVADAFQPADGFAAQVGGWCAGGRDRQEHADRPQCLAAAWTTVVAPWSSSPGML